ncbi:ionotropic receptor 25a-like isoform X13 [Leptopilina boulardi]|uniref:ionotropic receptor 25a-like isoform X1 n=1 Tax=Leptopilina boulardi TaxID=63433 RepID=UPI0021F68DE6|nr:ionotropic receptor 25a-like isoform X1 [Leptopilina boulardi]XP_051160877.1 ionotropic receptor 25a-like isoform X2 [Leptopilina boulardi]XP_051160878.1 ionotropic receptor 25a-like isoform X3 [Leptopilina boulardi]XP_051160879.1 ionotropic receptor 25a-like isoform X4 [Leptopilina boulardi]XP_051160880.1 ionotropic receptor 25a-like isoform X5 [Leptopilina boulardi]XP_051160881.1 ionotropic receptor 25a-like isoform X6 [Leptopilina boulardi]XP_051160882.1 ionotropic receptor 25a-like iso
MLSNTKSLFPVFILFLPGICSQKSVTLLVVIEKPDATHLRALNEILPRLEKETGNNNQLKIDAKKIEVDRENVDTSFQEVCQYLSGGITLILDFTWTGWDRLKKMAFSQGIVYIRGDVSISPFVQAMDDLLFMKNTTDSALIFENEKELNETLYYLIGNSIIRLVVIDDFSQKQVEKIIKMRPLPSYYVIYASTENMATLFKTAIDGALVTRNGTWNLVFTDFRYQNFQYYKPQNDMERIDFTVTTMNMKNEVCCRLLSQTDSNSTSLQCDCSKDKKISEMYFQRLIEFIVKVLKNIETGSPIKGDCKNNNSKPPKNIVSTFLDQLNAELKQMDKFYFDSEKLLIAYNAEIEINILQQGRVSNIATWTKTEKVKALPDQQIIAAKRYFRVGTTPAIPWTVEDGVDENGNIKWKGYCIDLIAKLAEVMDFEYDLVIPNDREFGAKTPNGEWTGLVGDLAKGETDIAVAALTMTSEREEVIDFVAPYFEQSGILIVMRKPERETSLFKFMTVLRVEVWLSIVGALTLTAIMIWFLDKYSPYSARNNKKLYPYPCRQFTLKESFWFALTSFTPQGGGEAPKALSSRTLVAAYWLFVVLMLATFTANLAAFLTVERMQSPVQSLEQLARQSRINYSVLTNSTIYQYFKNMKNAEEKLYNVWKEITLNSTTDQVEYRVWDYPIKEQYGHILQSIHQAGLLNSTEEGFKKVLESKDSLFAFIHDSQEIKYRVTLNCSLTEVGEVFAEQPYAIAVQQGSHLQEEISRKILDLQKDRFFEGLNFKYWNSTLKRQCTDADDNEGITLESLGGVFIATLIGLALAMLTLAVEVLYNKKKNKTQDLMQKESKEFQLTEKAMRQFMKKLPFKAAPTVAFVEKPPPPKPRISHISVYPRPFPFKE